MNSVALLVADRLLPEHQIKDDISSIELNRQLDQLKPAFDKHSMALELVSWRSAPDQASSFAAMLPLYVWDYFEGNEEAFAKAVQGAAGQTQILNPPSLLNWNANKRYLDELSRQGASVIPTRVVKRISAEQIAEAFTAFASDQLVVKPLVGGGAWRQVLLQRDQPLPPADQMPPAEAMLQAFQPSVIEEGEFSFLFFGGQFSHGLVKRPTNGDYRIQAMYGGTETTYQPTAVELGIAQEILDGLDLMPTYARVDLLRGDSGGLQLIELELIEPFLYLSHASEEHGINQGADLLAQTVAESIG